MNGLNFDIAQKYSYAYVDNKYAKIAIAATGNAVLADPLKWDYAQTHSYVKVNPSSIGVTVPSDVENIYAKVIYLSGDVGNTYTAGSGINISTQNEINVLCSNGLSFDTNKKLYVNILDPIFNVFYQKQDKLTPTSGITIDENNNIGISATIPNKTSQLTNDSGFLTSHQSLDNYYTKSEINTNCLSSTNPTGSGKLTIPSIDTTNLSATNIQINGITNNSLLIYNNGKIIALSQPTKPSVLSFDGTNYVWIEYANCTE